jgi:type II secretory pathway predicted ATPase ExeA
MYLEHFGLHEPPFRITPHTDFFFDGANRGAMLDALIYAITHDEGIVKISGEVGSGKTMLCRVLMERLPDNITIVYLANPSLSREDILYAIADELHLDITDNARASLVLRTLQNHLIESFSAGRQVVVLIDEAHAMPVETLEQIRLLSNLESNRHKLLQLVLFGQPELNDILARADMRQLKERITHNFELAPLVRNDITSYLDFRMRAAGYRGPSVFTPAALKMIAQTSHGLTRRINILADKALLAAFATNSHQVGAKEAQAAIRDCEFSEATHTNKNLRKKIVVLTLCGLALSTLAAAAWLLSAKQSTTPRRLVPASQPIAPPSSIREAPPATTPASASASATSVSATVASPVAAASNPMPAATLPSSATPLVRERLEAGQRWLEQAPNDRWFIQLLATDADQQAQVENFLRKAANNRLDMDKLHVYASSLSAKPRLGVIYGDYPTRLAAAAAIGQLPLALRKTKPYPRQVIRLR